MKNTALCLSNAVGRCLGSFNQCRRSGSQNSSCHPRLPPSASFSRYQFDTFSSFLFPSKNLHISPFDVSRVCNTRAVRDLQRTRSQPRSGHVRGSDGYSPEPVRFELVHILLIYTRQPERAFRRGDRCRLFHPLFWSLLLGSFNGLGSFVSACEARSHGVVLSTLTLLDIAFRWPCCR